MADSIVTPGPGQHSVTVAHQERPASTLRFDLFMGFLSMGFVSKALGPMLLSLTALLSVFTFFTC